MTSLNPIVSSMLRGKASGPRVLITGGIHGDEFEPMAAVRHLARALEGKLPRGRVTILSLDTRPVVAHITL